MPDAAPEPHPSPGRAAGQGSPAPYGLAGSVAARAVTSSRGSRCPRSHSMAPGMANCDPPRPSTKYPRRIRPDSSIHTAPVKRGEPTRQAFGQHGLAGEDAIPLDERGGTRQRDLGGPDAVAAERAHQRPASRRTGGDRVGPQRVRRRPAPGRGTGPQRPERVVGDLARPHQVPQRVQQLVLRCPERLRQLAEERGPPRAKVVANLRLQPPCGGISGLRQQPLHVVAEVERHPAVAGAERATPDPHHLAGPQQVVEDGRAVAVHALGQHVALEHGGGQRQSLEVPHHSKRAVGTAVGGSDPLPVGQKPRECFLWDRLRLPSQRGERATAQRLEDLRMTVFTRSAGSELTADQNPIALQRVQPAGRGPGSDAPAGGEVLGGERNMRPGVAADQLAQRVGAGLQKRLREAGRKSDAERVAVPGRRPRRRSSARRPAGGSGSRDARHAASSPMPRRHLVGRARPS